MKLPFTIAFLFVATTALAQDLPRRPTSPKTNDLTSSPPFSSLVQDQIFRNSPISDGMVWVPAGRVWYAREVNSCEWCGRPMSFKEAAFDKKMTSMWLLEIALTVTDIELGQACLRAGRCKEGNPLLGTGSRPVEYGIRLPSIAAGWLSTAMLRKGSKAYHVGGMKHWYVIPMIEQTLSTVGVITGATH